MKTIAFKYFPEGTLHKKKSREVVCRKVLRYKKLINREIVPWRVPKCAMSRICKQRAGRGSEGIELIPWADVDQLPISSK